MNRNLYLVLIAGSLCGCPDVAKYEREVVVDAGRSGDATNTPDRGVTDAQAVVDLGVGADGGTPLDAASDLGQDATPSVDGRVADARLDAMEPAADGGVVVPDRCRVSFTVTLPVGTPDEPLFIAGVGFGTPEWVPNEAALALSVVGGVATLERETGHLNRLTYKYTRGTWDTVESAADCSEITNRSIVVDCAGGQAYAVNDAVSRWADLCD